MMLDACGGQFCAQYRKIFEAGFLNDFSNSMSDMRDFMRASEKCRYRAFYDAVQVFSALFPWIMHTASFIFRTFQTIQTL